jgi:hypothetical protein
VDNPLGDGVQDPHLNAYQGRDLQVFIALQGGRVLSF